MLDGIQRGRNLIVVNRWPDELVDVFDGPIGLLADTVCVVAFRLGGTSTLH